MTDSDGRYPYQAPSGPLRRIDDWIFAVEMGVLWTFLALSCGMVFLDVVYRRLAAPDSKVAELTARILGIEDPTTIEKMTVAGPIVSGFIALGLLYFAFWTAERHAHPESSDQSKSRPIVRAVLSAGALGVLGWLMLQPWMESRWFYMLLYALASGLWLWRLFERREPAWPKYIFAFLVTTAIFLSIATNYFPDGYSWSKELSLIMLLWVGFLGASVCAHEGRHIQMGALKRIIPPGLQRWSNATGFMVTAGFCLFMALLGYLYAREALTLAGRFEQTNLPDWIATIAVPAAFLMTSIRYVAAAISSVMGGSYGAAPEEEVLAVAKERKAEG